MGSMERRGITFSVASLLGLVACVALNLWCFRVHVLLGLVAINITKHVVIAQLCQALGVNRRTATTPEGPKALPTPPPAPAGAPSP
jgi:hypothetical protein